MPDKSADLHLHVITLRLVKFIYLSSLSGRREEVHGEAQRVLRCLPGRNRKDGASKQMPSFPEMVYYIQEKVWYLLSNILLVSFRL